MMNRVELVPYDRSWPGCYERVRPPLSDALGGALVSIEHVGSTSVPGLCARPVVDVAVGIDSFERCAEMLVEALERLGFTHVPELEAELPDRRHFVRGGYHVHVCEEGQRELRAYAVFRDHLRRSEPDRDAYADLKLRLAREGGRDRARYQRDKGPFIRALLERVGG